MNYERLLILACAAAFSAGSTLAALIVIPAHARLQRGIARRPARERARLLLALRIMPFAAGVVTTLGVALAFVRYEPRHTTEPAGAVLLLTGGLALLLAVLAAWRLAVAGRQTAKCHRLVGRCGRRIDLPDFPIPAWRINAGFPVAAVSGVLRPRLIISARILDECSADELLAVLRHERAHVLRYDNLVRALVLGLPDILALSKHGDRMMSQWHRAAEDAADDEAVRSGAGARMALAGALVRVGRMATEPPPRWMPALALFDGDDLEGRVRRLLDPEAALPGAGVPRHATVVLSGVLLAAIAWAVTGPRPLHLALEWAVRNLP